ncbi:MAG: hypothetical protein E7Z91_02020 [Cyanobacteria bacterium SIG30]|nr:hypothetical protein [Cyanobacteria bacterium SIG30]
MIIRRKNSENLLKVELEQEEKTIGKRDDILVQVENADITSIEFKERIERRRGDRRKGYRRIDERTLVSRAQEEAQSIKETAYKEGFEKGLAESREEIAIFKESLQSFFGAKKEICENISSHILELGVEVAKKIIKKEVELNNDILKGVLDEVLEKISSDEQKITVKVANSDLAYAQSILPDLLIKAHIEAKMSIVPDDEVEKGSCILIASNGVVDANFKTQLKLIQNAFEIYD